MYLPDLITSVPDLQTARILAAAGVDYIAFHQNIENLEEIKPWLQGPQIGVEITNPDLSLPGADFLIMPLEWFDQFSFSGRPILWKAEGDTVQTSENLLFTRGSIMNETEPTTGMQFSFSGRPILWKAEGDTVQTSENLLFTRGSIMNETEPTTGMQFYHYADYISSKSVTAKAWLDYKEDLSLFEELFL